MTVTLAQWRRTQTQLRSAGLAVNGRARRVLADGHTLAALGSLSTVLVMLTMAGPQRLFPEPMGAATILSWPWLAVGAALGVEFVALGRLVRADRHRRRMVAGCEVDSLSDAIALGEQLLLASARGDDLWAGPANAPLAALIFAASPRGNNQGMAWVAALTAPLSDEGCADGWVNAVAEMARVDLKLCRCVAGIVGMDVRQRASVGAVTHEAVFRWAGSRR